MIVLEPAAEVALRGGFAVLMGAAAWHKMADLTRFRGTLRAYLRDTPLARPAVVTTAMVTVVAAEAAGAALLLIPVAPAGLGAGLAAALLLAYGLAMAANLARGNRLLDCGCHWGDATHGVGWPLVIRNLLLAGALLPMVLPPAMRPPGSLDLISGVLAGALLLLTYAAADRLLLNHSLLNGETP